MNALKLVMDILLIYYSKLKVKYLSESKKDNVPLVEYNWESTCTYLSRSGLELRYGMAAIEVLLMHYSESEWNFVLTLSVLSHQM